MLQAPAERPDIATQKYVVETSGEIEQLTASYRQNVPKGLNSILPSFLSPRHASSLPFLDPEVHVQSRTVPRLTAGPPHYELLTA